MDKLTKVFIIITVLGWSFNFIMLYRYFKSDTGLIDVDNWTYEEDCTSDWYHPVKNHLPINKDKPYEEKLVRVTKYGWTGYRMANMEYPYIGAVASSDRSIPFGTLVGIDGKQYVVKDRTAYWIWEKFGQTFDIYSEDTEKEMLKFGSKNKLIKIYD